MPVFFLFCLGALCFLLRFFLALWGRPVSSRNRKVWFIRARMHRIMAENRYHATLKRAA